MTFWPSSVCEASAIIVQTAVCFVVYDSCKQQYAHQYEQFWNLCLVWVRLFLCGLVCTFLCFHGSLDHFGFVLLASFVRFGFFSTEPRDWLRGTSPQWFILCRVGRKTLLYLCICLQGLPWQTRQRDFALTVRPNGRELVAFMAGNGETQLSMYTTACKNSVMRCWCGYLSGARCTLFAYGQADATAIPKTLPVLPHLNRDRFYLSGTSLPTLSWKRGR